MEEYTKYLIEKNVSAEILEEVRIACTRHWGEEFSQTPSGRTQSDEVVFKRHDNTIRHIVPWLSKHVKLGNSKVVDFGAGCGSSSLALSRFAGLVHGFDIHSPSGDAFSERMRLFGVKNVHFTLADPEEIATRAADEIDSNSIIILVAVVEHLTELEQITYLKKFWNSLSPGQLLVIVETPNYYSYLDSHTFGLPFANFVPDAFFVGWLQRNGSELRFRDDLLTDYHQYGTNTILENRRRRGLGVNPEVFRQAFECDLNEIVVADGFDECMLKWFDISFDDQILLSVFDRYQVDLPVGFAKNVLSFIFRKPVSLDQVNDTKKWNQEHRENIINIHSLTSERDSLREALQKHNSFG